MGWSWLEQWSDSSLEFLWGYKPSFGCPEVWPEELVRTASSSLAKGLCRKERRAGHGAQIEACTAWSLGAGQASQFSGFSAGWEWWAYDVESDRKKWLAKRSNQERGWGLLSSGICYSWTQAAELGESLHVCLRKGMPGTSSRHFQVKRDY